MTTATYMVYGSEDGPIAGTVSLKRAIEIAQDYVGLPEGERADNARRIRKAFRDRTQGVESIEREDQADIYKFSD